MKPIAIFQHTEVGAPGAVIPILESLGLRCHVIRIVDGEAVPPHADEFAGLVFMGGYMNVHDPLPWIPQELALIRQADEQGIPVAGHCLGSQLLALALGGTVRRNTQAEIGWQQIRVEDHGLAEQWWGVRGNSQLLTFQWHGDTLDLPLGASRIASSPYCSNQGFVVRNIHLGIQSHLEMTPNLVEFSLQRNGGQLEREYQRGNPAVSSMPETLRELPARTALMHITLQRLYSRWVQGCA